MLDRLREAIHETVSKLRAVAGKEILKVAIGVPVPAIEAWYLYRKNPQLYEATWIRWQQGENIAYDRVKLKEECYGNSRPSIELEIECAVREAKRIIENDLLNDLENAFPQGFGSLANEIRSWKP